MFSVGLYILGIAALANMYSISILYPMTKLSDTSLGIGQKCGHLCYCRWGLPIWSRWELVWESLSLRTAPSRYFLAEWWSLWWRSKQRVWRSEAVPHSGKERLKNPLGRYTRYSGPTEQDTIPLFYSTPKEERDDSHTPTGYPADLTDR